MALSDRNELFRAARAAYERGRWRRALLAAWPVPIAVLFAQRAGSSLEWVATLGTLLLAAVVVLRWRGQEIGHAVAPGLTAGIAPLVIPALTVRCVDACVESCAPGCATWSWCQVSCLGAGILAGAFVGLRAAWFGPGRTRFMIAALAVSAATGALGCLLGGALGVAGMAAGFAIGAVPALVLLPRTA